MLIYLMNVFLFIIWMNFILYFLVDSYLFKENRCIVVFFYNRMKVSKNEMSVYFID